jgi:release factor glutamine methyltransferase
MNSASDGGRPPAGPTVGELLREGRRRLAGLAFQPPPREAALLLAEALGWNEARLLARSDATVATDVAACYRAWLERRAFGEPVAYLFGRREFYGRDFAVDRRVLIPRPETEHLVELALGLDLPKAPRILDIGTGSGILAVTLAAELPAARVVATDLSLDALQVARANARSHGVAARVSFLHTDLAAGVDLGAIDLLVSNPPYVDPEAELSTEVRDHEPHLALFAPDQGRQILHRLLHASAGLRPHVPVLWEIGYDQADWLAQAARESPLVLQAIHPDYAGHPRVAQLRRR